jgi:hypothetical protein
MNDTRREYSSGEDGPIGKGMYGRAEVVISVRLCVNPVIVVVARDDWAAPLEMSRRLYFFWRSFAVVTVLFCSQCAYFWSGMDIHGQGAPMI